MTGAHIKEYTLSQPIEWTEENKNKLLQCESVEDFELHFPGRNIETLKRRQREFKTLPGGAVIYPNDLLDEDNSNGSISLTGDSGVIKTGTVADPITDWTDTLKVWGLDPEVFEVVQPVTMKAWGKPAEFRYSYAARIQKKAEVEADLEDKFDVAGWREHLRSISNYSNHSSLQGGLTYTVLVADPQLGKPGTTEAVANWTRGIEGHSQRINYLIDSGLPIDEIALVFMGDEHEGAVGNYASQPYEVELNYSDQLELDFDMRIWSIKTLVESTKLPMQLGSVPSNHGEHTRFGSNKSLTSIYDNSSTMIAALVQKTLDQIILGENLTWQIAKDRQDVNLELNGVKANFTHGHISHGSGSKTGGVSAKSAIEKQILGRTNEMGDISLYFSAHYHHFNTIEDRGRTFFGCPALEAEKSSRWFYDGSGVWSKPGMLGMVVGKALDRNWSELSVQ
jgi:hypothetical protein